MKTHLLHKAEIVLSRPSTQTEVEVEDAVQAKDEVVVVATRAKMRTSSSQMICREWTLADEDSPEAGGEVAEIFREIMQEMIAENVGIVGEHVTFRVIVHQGSKVIEDNKIIMHLLAKVMMIMKGYLLCNM